jgi:hypothetical protein
MVSSQQPQTPPDLGFWLLDHPTPSLQRTVLLGAMTSLWITGEVAAGVARELVSAGSRLARRERPPRV